MDIVQLKPDSLLFLKIARVQLVYAKLNLCAKRVPNFLKTMGLKLNTLYSPTFIREAEGP